MVVERLHKKELQVRLVLLVRHRDLREEGRLRLVLLVARGEDDLLLVRRAMEEEGPG